jgi:hypothetical protein
LQAQLVGLPSGSVSLQHSQLVPGLAIGAAKSARRFTMLHNRTTSNTKKGGHQPDFDKLSGFEYWIVAAN